MFKKEIVVDCRGHLLGRLAARVAKELLNGQHVTLVRCEEMNISGSLFTCRLKFQSFLRKKSNTNPRKGSHIHHRTPSKMVWRVIRGMLPHKTPRGKIALGHLKTYEGIPHQYETVKRVCMPEALRILRLQPHRQYCRLGDLANKVGWKQNALLGPLEEARKKRSAAYYEQKKQKLEMYKQCKDEALKELQPEEQSILIAAGKA